MPRDPDILYPFDAPEDYVWPEPASLEGPNWLRSDADRKRREALEAARKDEQEQS